MLCNVIEKKIVWHLNHFLLTDVWMCLCLCYGIGHLRSAIHSNVHSLFLCIHFSLKPKPFIFLSDDINPLEVCENPPLIHSLWPTQRVRKKKLDSEASTNAIGNKNCHINTKHMSNLGRNVTTVRASIVFHTQTAFSVFFFCSLLVPYLFLVRTTATTLHTTTEKKKRQWLFLSLYFNGWWNVVSLHRQQYHYAIIEW